MCMCINIFCLTIKDTKVVNKYIVFPYVCVVKVLAVCTKLGISYTLGFIYTCNLRCIYSLTRPIFNVVTGLFNKTYNID